MPWNNPKASAQGFAPRGMDVDGKGVVWTVLSSGQLASFDRRKCKGPLNGPTATGQHCPEGWTLYALPGPNYQGAIDSASADSAYYNFVDRFDMLGLGKDVSLATGNLSEGLLALVDGKFMTLPHALSDGVLREGDRRPHRRSEGRMEGQGRSGPASRRAHRSTWKAAAARRASWSSSRCARTRSRSSPPSGGHLQVARPGRLKAAPTYPGRLKAASTAPRR